MELKKTILYLVLCIISLFTSNAKTLQSNNIILQGKYKYENESNLLSLKLQDSIFSTIMHANLYPESGLKNWGTRFYEENLFINLGNLSFSGLKNCMNNPNWYSIDALKTIKIDSPTTKSKNPSNWSNSTPFSLFASYTIPFENSVSFKPVMSLAWTPSFSKDENANKSDTLYTDKGLYFASVLFPFKFKGKEKNKNCHLDLTINYGTNFLETNDQKWYIDEPFFIGEREHFFMEALYFYNKYFSLKTIFGQNTCPQGDVKLYERTDVVLSIDFSQNIHFSTEGRIFLCQNDVHTLSLRTLRTPLHYCILPNFCFDFKNSSLSVSFLFDSEYKYSGGKDSLNLNSNLYQAAMKLEFLYWNLRVKYTHSDDDEYFFGFWVQALKNKTATLNLNGQFKFFQEYWTATGLVRCTFHSKKESFFLTTSVSIQNDYILQSPSFSGKASFSCFGATAGCTIKKAASKSDSADSNTAFDFYLGYCAKF